MGDRPGAPGLYGVIAMSGAGRKRSGCAWIVIIALGIVLALVLINVGGVVAAIVALLGLLALGPGQ